MKRKNSIFNIHSISSARVADGVVFASGLKRMSIFAKDYSMINMHNNTFFANNVPSGTLQAF